MSSSWTTNMSDSKDYFLEKMLITGLLCVNVVGWAGHWAEQEKKNFQQLRNNETQLERAVLEATPIFVAGREHIEDAQSEIAAAGLSYNSPGDAASHSVSDLVSSKSDSISARWGLLIAPDMDGNDKYGNSEGTHIPPVPMYISTVDGTTYVDMQARKDIDQHPNHRVPLFDVKYVYDGSTERVYLTKNEVGDLSLITENGVAIDMDRDEQGMYTDYMMPNSKLRIVVDESDMPKFRYDAQFAHTLLEIEK
jgi:hypothetical protein